MQVPQEIQEYIIDEFATTQSTRRLLQLRLVSQTWRPRVDFHAFRTVNMTIDEAPMFLQFIKTSKYDIRKCIRRLNISRNVKDAGTEPTDAGEYLQEAGYSSADTYLKDFTGSLPHLEAMDLVGLYPWHMEYVPCFPTARRFMFKETLVRSSQLSAILRASNSLESIGHRRCSITMDPIDGEADTDRHHSDDRETLLSRVASLKAYAVLFSKYVPETKSLESFLLPTLCTLSLRCIVFRHIEPVNFPLVARIMNASTQSLQYLYLNFRSEVPMSNSDELRKTFDLSQCNKLKYIRFEGVRFSNLQLCLEGAFVILELLPNSRSDIIACLAFFEDWKGGQEQSRRLDQIVSSNKAIKKLEIGVPTPQRDRENIANDLSRSFAKGILSVCCTSDLRLVKLNIVT